MPTITGTVISNKQKLVKRCYSLNTASNLLSSFQQLACLLSQPYMIYPVKQPQHMFRDYIVIQTAGQEISWSCLLETGIRNCYWHSNQPTLPTQRGDVRLVCQILNYCKFLFKLKSFVFNMQIWNQWKGVSTSDTHAIKKVKSIRLLSLESETVTIYVANLSLQQWACQALLQTTITFRDHALAIVFWKAVHWNWAFISFDDTISFVILTQKKLKLNIDNLAYRNNGSPQEPYK